MSSDPKANGRETTELLVLGGDIVTMSVDRGVVTDGALAASGGKITWLGSAGEARRRFEATRTIDADGRLVLPGLVDTHFHTGQQLLRGKLTELARRRQLKLPIWRNYLIPFESVLTEEDMSLSAEIAYANLCGSGRPVSPTPAGPIPTRWPARRYASGSEAWSPNRLWISATDFPRR